MLIPTNSAQSFYSTYPASRLCRQLSFIFPFKCQVPISHEVGRGNDGQRFQEFFAVTSNFAVLFNNISMSAKILTELRLWVTNQHFFTLVLGDNPSGEDSTWQFHMHSSRSAKHKATGVTLYFKRASMLLIVSCCKFSLFFSFHILSGSVVGHVSSGNGRAIWTN